MAGMVGLLVDVEGQGVVLPVEPEGAVLQVEFEVQEICNFCVNLSRDFELMLRRELYNSLSQPLDIRSRKLYNHSRTAPVSPSMTLLLLLLEGFLFCFQFCQGLFFRFFRTLKINSNKTFTYV